MLFLTGAWSGAAAEAFGELEPFGNVKSVHPSGKFSWLLRLGDIFHIPECMHTIGHVAAVHSISWLKVVFVVLSFCFCFSEHGGLGKEQDVWKQGPTLCPFTRNYSQW